MALNEILVEGLGGAGNWLSTVERIKQEINRTQVGEEDLIKLALITRIKFYTKHRFSFNLASSFMLTEPGQVIYEREDPPGAGNGFPAGLKQIDGVYIHPTPVTDINAPEVVDRSWPMDRKHIGALRVLQSGSSTGTSRPFAYSFAGGQGGFYVYPRPNAVYRIQFDHLSSLDFPRARWVGGQWDFFDSFGASIEEDYSTPWLEHAEELIRNGAKADLFANVFRDDQAAVMARGQETAALSNLKKAAGMSLATGQVTPYFGGPPGWGNRY